MWLLQHCIPVSVGGTQEAETAVERMEIGVCVYQELAKIQSRSSVLHENVL